MNQVFPYCFYPTNQVDFQSARSYEAKTRSTLMGSGALVADFHAAFYRAYERQVTFRYVMGISSVDYYRCLMHGAFGRRATSLLDDVWSNLRSFDVDIRVASDSPPYCMFLNASECLYAVIDRKDPGTVTADPISISTHQKYFDREYSQGQPVEKWWDLIAANLECRFVDAPFVAQLAQGGRSAAAAASEATEYDVFICHASEDKDSVARPLAKALSTSGLRIWYDEFELRVGDSLRRRIDHGLSLARFGVIILSPSFFKKKWPQYELDGLIAKEVAGPDGTILPVWVNIGQDEIVKFSPLLADRIACNINVIGLPETARRIGEVIRAASS